MYRGRLLNGYLAGTIDEPAFQATSAELEREAEEAECQLDEAGNFDPSRRDTALSVFDFSQNLDGIWRGSDFTVRREILECVRTMGVVA